MKRNFPHSINIFELLKRYHRNVPLAVNLKHARGHCRFVSNTFLRNHDAPKNTTPISIPKAEEVPNTTIRTPITDFDESMDLLDKLRIKVNVDAVYLTQQSDKNWSEKDIEELNAEVGASDEGNPLQI